MPPCDTRTSLYSRAPLTGPQTCTRPLCRPAAPGGISPRYERAPNRLYRLLSLDLRIGPSVSGAQPTVVTDCSSILTTAEELEATCLLISASSFSVEAASSFECAPVSPILSFEKTWN